MSPKMPWRRAVLPLSALLVISAGSAGSLLSAQTAQRQWIEGSAVATTATNRSELLLNPALVTAVDDDYVVFDAGDFAVKRVGDLEAGSHRWRAGRVQPRG